MKLLQYLKAYWFKIQKKVEKYPVTSLEIGNVLDRKIQQVDGRGPYSEVCDIFYKTCDKQTMEQLIKLIPIKRLKYDASRHDCDNFAREFWGLTSLLFPNLPIGYCHLKTDKGILHAANFCFYKDVGGNLAFTFIEPQTGDMKYFNWRPYVMIV